jgi:hypothetical protein
MQSTSPTHYAVPKARRAESPGAQHLELTGFRISRSRFNEFSSAFGTSAENVKWVIMIAILTELSSNEAQRCHREVASTSGNADGESLKLNTLGKKFG